MAEQYKGYEIRVDWHRPGLGYQFLITDSDGSKIKESAPYFEKENAISGAKGFIDKMEEEKEG